MDFYLCENYKQQLLNIGLDAVKTASKRVIHKSGKFIGNKTAGVITNSNDHKIVKPDENPGNVKEIVIPLEKREEILNELREVLL